MSLLKKTYVDCNPRQSALPREQLLLKANKIKLSRTMSDQKSKMPHTGIQQPAKDQYVSDKAVATDGDVADSPK